MKAGLLITYKAKSDHLRSQILVFVFVSHLCEVVAQVDKGVEAGDDGDEVDEEGEEAAEEGEDKSVPCSPSA